MPEKRTKQTKPSQREEPRSFPSGKLGRTTSHGLGNQALLSCLTAIQKKRLGGPTDKAEDRANVLAHNAMSSGLSALTSPTPRPTSHPDPHTQNPRITDGQGLSPSQRRFFDPRFKKNLSSVRVHRLPVEHLQLLGAKAFSIGSNVVLPNSNQDQQLIAHELGHVVDNMETGDNNTLRRAPMTLAEIDALLSDYERQAENTGLTPDQQHTLFATRNRLLQIRQQLVTGGPAAVDWSLAVSGPQGVNSAEPNNGLASHEELQKFYKRLSGFSSGMEMISAMIKQVITKIRKEQDSTYVFSDRTFTRPVVLKLYRNTKSFAAHTRKFLDENSDKDPTLATQLNTDLSEFEKTLSSLRSAVPSKMGLAEKSGRRFVGGVKGAGGTFLGFLRLGLIDSWGQFIWDGSERRIQEASDGMANMMVSVDEKGFGTTVSDAVVGGTNRMIEADEMGYHTQSGEMFGSAAFDAYFMGRGLFSGVKGVAQFSKAVRAFKAMGMANPVRAAMMVTLKEAATFRGLGMHGGRGVMGSQYGMAGMGDSVNMIRVVNSESDLVAKHFRPTNTGGSQRILMPDSGEVPSARAVERTHISTSEGSPYQSGAPMGDIETYLLANPQNYGVVGQGSTVTTVRVPLRGLRGANEMLLEGAGVETSGALKRGMFGKKAPPSVRPTDTGEYSNAGYSGKSQAWVEENFGVSNKQALKVFNNEGTPFYEWEQIALAPDLRPYVVSSQANPFSTTGRPLANLNSSRVPFYNPALNPKSAYGLANSFPEGWRSFQGYNQWLQGGAGASHGFTFAEMMGFERMALLGGGPFSMPLPYLPPGYRRRRRYSSMSASTSRKPRVSSADIQNYMKWSTRASGVSNPMLTAAGGGNVTVMEDLTSRATGILAEARGMGVTASAFHMGPNVATMSLNAPNSHTTLQAIMAMVKRRWRGVDSKTNIAIQINIQRSPSSSADDVDTRALKKKYSLPNNVVLTITYTR